MKTDKIPSIMMHLFYFRLSLFILSLGIFVYRNIRLCRVLKMDSVSFKVTNSRIYLTHFHFIFKIFDQQISRFTRIINLNIKE